MFSLLYDGALLLLALIALPKLLWQCLTQGKYRSSLSARLGFSLPKIDRSLQPLIWIHAVSMGETRAAIPLFHWLRTTYPHAQIVISATTETGYSEAKRSMADAQAHFFLPLDFSWTIRRIVKKLKPSALILVESDFWYQLIHQVTEAGGKVCVVNGKLSEKSMKRLQQFPFFARHLFDPIEHLCLQSERYRERFEAIGINPLKVTVTGNLKYDAPPATMLEPELRVWKERLGIQPSDRVIVIGSSHDPEEEWLLSALDPLWKAIPQLKVILVPRHPERFSAVAELLKARHIAVGVYSEPQPMTGQEKVILIDAMGLLNTCYQIAEIAIVAGSFVDGIGGHNIVEPVLSCVPVLFGPHMKDQLDLVDLVVLSHAGKQVALKEVAFTLMKWLTDPEEMASYQKGCEELKTRATGSLKRTCEALTASLQLDDKR